MASVMESALSEIVHPMNAFYRDSKRLLMRCTKPDRNEFMTISKATIIGFFVLGFLGYLVKLIHIPVKNILVGA